MYTVIYIKPTKTEGYLTLGIDAGGDRIRFCIKEEVKDAFGITTPPHPLSEEEFLELKEIADRHDTLKAALSLLAYQDNSRRQLYGKLRRRGFSDAHAKEAIRECERLGYLNEDRQLENLVRSLATVKLYGKERIVASLSVKGYAQSKVRAVLSQLTESGEIDFEALAERLLLKHRIPSRDSDEARALLYRYGYRN